ncbi:flagellar-associated protein [Chloropicon primus]|uniref:Flagellar-associated protein n=1 Tax=Chloropicon primus TaxID=1764295 RepID=A0A5B8MGN3_9CHLO|nr:flagellar-associated protein [Chloropicon primus]UPQ97719.1 flagellar-associated protein [Chloropicon primus]|eukprot:QDZ18510.1 flagellar-associated protein [Chloropicon primus]
MSFLSRSRSYQGGPYVEVFSSQGRDPLQNTKVTNKKGVRKIYDKSVRGYVIYSSTSASARLQLPKDDRKALKLSQPYFVVQVFVPVGQAFSIAMNIKDKSHTRRRLHFSSSFSDIKATPLHCQIPLISLIRGKWLNLVLNIEDFVWNNFPGQSFLCIDTVEIGGISKIRKIFTLREEPGTGDVPRHLDYPTGVDVDTQFLDSDSIKDNEGVKKLREATNQIRPLTEPLVKEIDRNEAPASAKGGQNGPVRIAFGTRFPAPTSSPPKNKRSIGKGLEISISDEKSSPSSGPASPVVKLPTVLSPRAKTVHSGSATFLEALQGNSRGGNSVTTSSSKKFSRDLPTPSASRKLLQEQQSTVPVLSRHGRRAYFEQAEKSVDGTKGFGESGSSESGIPDLLGSSPIGGQSLMQMSPPQKPKVKKAYSKFRYSDCTNNSPRAATTDNRGASASCNNNAGSQGPQPLEDIPLNKQQCTTTSTSQQVVPQNGNGFGLDSSRSNWESLYTDQSMQTPDRPAQASRISLLPLSSQYDMFGDPGDSKASFDKGALLSHSKSDSMSSDSSERIQSDSSRLLSSRQSSFRRSVEFKDTEASSSPNGSTRSGSERDLEDELDYGLFNVNNAFVGQTPELHPCNSELLDEPVRIHEDEHEGQEEEGNQEIGKIVGAEASEDRGVRKNVELPPHAISLDPLPVKAMRSLDRPFTSKSFPREREESAKAAVAPMELKTTDDEMRGGTGRTAEASATETLKVGHPEHHRTFDLEEIMGSTQPELMSRSSYSETTDEVLEEDEPSELVEVDEVTKRQRDLINKHRIFTPPVIPASKVYENDHLAPAVTDFMGSFNSGVNQERLEEADDGNTMMDLIYDPILNCYYDAKANRYYELK